LTKNLKQFYFVMYFFIKQNNKYKLLFIFVTNRFSLLIIKYLGSFSTAKKQTPIWQSRFL
jgi:hypothetical protein